MFFAEFCGSAKTRILTFLKCKKIGIVQYLSNESTFLKTDPEPSLGWRVNSRYGDRMAYRGKRD